MKLLKLLNIEDSETDASSLLNHLTNAGFIVESKRVETADKMKSRLPRSIGTSLFQNTKCRILPAWKRIKLLKKPV